LWWWNRGVQSAGAAVYDGVVLVAFVDGQVGHQPVRSDAAPVHLIGLE
jgi:hypothetical protein